MTVKYAPSLLSADFSKLAEQVKQVEDAGADVLHLDIMDGQFVPNITFGPLIVEWIRPVTPLLFETHLMIASPERYIDAFAEAGSDRILVHPETCSHLHRAMQQIKGCKKQAGVALNPSTPLDVIEYVMSEIDCILLMTVNPGFGGQSFIPEMLPKISKARDMIRQSGREIALGVDGGINSGTIAAVVSAGADLIIAGSSVYNANASVADNLRVLAAAAALGVG